MSNSLNLQALAQHRDALLLAEVAAWLHDYFKHTDGHIKKYVSSAPAPSGEQDAKDLIPNQNISLLGTTQAFKDARDRRENRILPGYLNRCHYAAHIEKQDANAQQSYPAYVSSPFGFEGSTIPANLTQDLRQRISWSTIGNSPFTAQHRNQLQSEIQALFTRVGGDTRRSTNEVPLWDWSHIVAALYKSALAGALLGYQPKSADDLRWRLLSVRVNVSRFLDSVTRVPDLLARKELLEDALERVRQLLEEIYPLATRVYQDEDGSIYVVPNLGHLLSLKDDQGKTLEELILQKFAEGTVRNDPNLKLAGELIPEIHLDNQPWWGQSPNRNPAQDEIPPVGAILSQVPDTSASHDYVLQIWQNTAEEICTVCRLRPQGPSQKARDRKVCDVCEQRRADRAKDWTQNLHTTIWTNEVADVNGRLALIVGRLGLERWLDSTMVQTLVVNEPQNGQAVTKNPTFARLRRIWETTRTFWQEALIECDAQGKPILVPAAKRLEIIPKNSAQLNLGKFHSYELLVNNIRISVVWDSKTRRFIVCENLAYLAKPEQLGRPLRAYLQPEKSFVLEEPDGAGIKNKEWGTITIESVNELPDDYLPVIPLLAEPRTFMALVPADKAMDVINAIRRKYEAEMGKVRNRLPITLGAVFFGRRTPLFAALDAARHMLDCPSNAGDWKVAAKTDHTPTAAGWPRSVQLTLTRETQNISVEIPAVLGDNETPDLWYPYWRVKNKITDRARWFVGPDGGHWIHVCDLRPGDCVQFTPSTFDFEYLDATARRFEITYDSNARRHSRPSRPCYLEDLERLDQVWEAFFQLSPTQQKQVLQTIETTRERWFGPNGLEASAKDETFEKFVETTLANAQWPKEQTWKSKGIASPPEAARNDMQTKLIATAARGELADLAELHLEILKEEKE
ncbi:MAG: CRISPR-associated protein Csx11 [Chloroflexota bacterium]